ncbi:MAG: MBOAT family protein, partial [Acidimicrobiia bacterium]|nr:MBOAT family protein [Acidimicrobiia bacterium]
MTFNSLPYAAFLAVVTLAVWRLRHRDQNRLLLVVSYLFYGAWDWRFLALLVGSTVIGYTAGIALEGTDDPARRRVIVMSRVALNLAILGVFKYANFFLSSAVAGLEAVGLSGTETSLRIILPIAISYYTFEEISYTVDIYRRDIRACRDPVAYGLFVAFFPKLVAGPILRPRELLPQIERPRLPPDADRMLSALGLLLWGLVKKVVIADTLAQLTNEIYARPELQSGLGLALGTVCFAGQIYGDFSGYTDMARGAARLLGFELPLNFRQPYLSSSLTAFWRTWHISLSSWLRDYLYIPLGGNRRGMSRTMVNLLTVMVLGGLWHGAGWTFLIWGAIH